ncbi:MAG: VWA domain-containing protein [Elusimicrobia bacterium]|nr:VWA domain-containing protein [Elusimicrobiota bacterium]
MRRNNVFILLIVVMFSAACDRSRRGPASEPDGGITSIDGVIAIVDKGEFPYSFAYFKLIDNNENAITDLKLGNVNVTEDSKPVVPLDIEKAYAPLAIVLILDRSGSMSGGPTDDLNEAASAFVDSLTEKDFVEIIEFGDEIEVSQSFTNDTDKLTKVIESGTANMGSTAFYDAVAKGIDDIQKIGGNRIIIAMSDGYDCASEDYDILEVIEYANDNDQPVNTISYGGSYGLDHIAYNTGGEFVEAATGDELYEAYQSMIPKPIMDHMSLQFRSLSDDAGEIKIYVVYGSLTCEFDWEYPEED